MDVSLFDYDLPEELIADTPRERGESRLMLLDKNLKTIEHRSFKDIVELIPDNVFIVFNNSKVIPARIFGQKETGGKVELLLVRKESKNLWYCMAKASKAIRIGDKIYFLDNVSAVVKNKKENLFLLEFCGIDEVLSYVDKYGDVPLPPYILKKRGEKKSRKEDRERYQTIYAKHEGSVAAPTAGLHFSDEILLKLRQKLDGRLEFIQLHVGPGTFAPVKETDLTKHKMHEEIFSIPEEVAERINDYKKSGLKLLAIGTTTVRALESSVSNGNLVPFTGSTSLFIYPGYKFKIVDHILTNFHLPKSTLLMMISAFAGRDFIMKAYKEAIDKRYRFYSYGDAMLIL